MLREAPPRELADFVESCWINECDLRGGFRITPDRYADLLFFGGPVWLDSEPLQRVVLLGPLTRTATLRAKGVLRCAGIRVEALALAAPPQRIGRVLDGREDAEVLRQLWSIARDWAARCTAQRELLAGRPRAQELARRLGVSRRQAERRFREWTRLSPRALSGVARFQAARDRIWREPSLPLAR
jgi:hypothetical protein